MSFRTFSFSNYGLVLSLETLIRFRGSSLESRLSYNPDRSHLVFVNTIGD